MEKIIELKIKNGKVIDSFSVELSDNGSHHAGGDPIGLKEIAIVIECLKKEQEKIMNKQKDETQKLTTTGNLILKVDKIEFTNGAYIVIDGDGLIASDKNMKHRVKLN